MSTPSPKIPASSSKAKFDDMMLRLGIKSKMRELINDGSPFKEAAEEAGVPFEMALALTKTDNDFHAMWSESNNQEDATPTRVYPSTVHRSPREVKEDFMNMLVASGLYEKLAQMAALAEPGTPEGDKVLMFFGRSIIPTMLPKENTEDHTVIELRAKSDEELKSMLKELRGRRITDGS